MPEAEVRMSEEKIGVPEALTSLIPAIKPCNCAVKDKIEREVNGKGWRIDELVGIPSATHGYIDSQTGKQDHSVRRRYSDFDFLHAHLNRMYPFHVIPPIPGKHSVTVSISSLFGRKETSRIIDHRVRGFAIFLRNVLAHPVLYQDHVVHLFLTEADGSGWKEEVLKYAPATIKALPASKLPKVLDKSFDDLLSILTAFEENCKALEVSQKTSLRRLQEIHSSFESLGTAYNSFSLEYAPLAEILDSVGEIYDTDASAFSEILLNQQLICESVHEFTKYVEAIKKAALNQASRAADLELITEQINLMRSDLFRDAAQTDPTEAEARQRALRAELESLNKSFWEEINIWLQRVRQQWKQLLTQMSSAEKNCSSQALSAWNNNKYINDK